MNNTEIKPGLLCYWSLNSGMPYIVEVIGKSKDKEGYWDCLGETIPDRFKDMTVQEILKTDRFVYRSHICIKEKDLVVWEGYDGPPFEVRMDYSYNKALVVFKPEDLIAATYSIEEYKTPYKESSELLTNLDQIKRADNTAKDLNKQYRHRKEAEMAVEYFKKYAKV